MNFFEITQKQHNATRLAEFMQNLTYKIKEDHEMANQLSRVAHKLTELDAHFGTRWERDFDENEKKLVSKCIKLMKGKTNAST
tara:strand:+ start:1396 stop:1644 length:249 start_codon:yes stop_codon:yes gene_type:complete